LNPKPTQMKKKINCKVIQNHHIHTLVKENIIQLTHSVSKIVLKCQKRVKKVAKNHIYV